MPGTNRFAILIDGYVFKIGMDKAGIIDNWAEFSLSQELQPFVTKCYECNGLISVAEYVTVISKEEFQNSKEEVRQILSHLAEGYLLGDVGAVNKNFMNWGYRPDGSLVILDFAYIYRVIGDELLCEGLNSDDTICKASLSYDDNFNKLICPRCGKVYTFHEIRRKIGKEYEQKELEVIKQIAFKVTKPSQEINVKDNARTTIETNNEGAKTMSKFYDDSYKNKCENHIEFDESDYEDAIQFMKSFHDHSRQNDNRCVNEVSEPVIKDMYSVEEAVDKLGDDNHIDPLPNDNDCDDDDDDLSIDDALAIIDHNDNIEDKNDDLEEETGIPDEELNEHEPQDETEEVDECEESEQDTIEGKFVYATPSENIVNSEYENNIDECNEETEETINAEEIEEPVDINITIPSNTNAEVEIKTSDESTYNTVKIDVSDDVMVLTTPENVDKMRAILNADLDQNDTEYDDELDTIYEKKYRDSKINKRRKHFEN